MKKKPASKAAANDRPKAYAVWYVEALSKARTPLKGFCFILLHQDTDPKLFTATPTSVRTTQANPIIVR